MRVVVHTPCYGRSRRDLASPFLDERVLPSQREYETEKKSELLAKALKAQEEEKKKYEHELKESEEGNRTLIMQFTLVQVGGLYAVRCGGALKRVSKPASAVE